MRDLLLLNYDISPSQNNLQAAQPDLLAARDCIENIRALPYDPHWVVRCLSIYYQYRVQVDGFTEYALFLPDLSVVHNTAVCDKIAEYTYPNLREAVMMELGPDRDVHAAMVSLHTSSWSL